MLKYRADSYKLGSIEPTSVARTQSLAALLYGVLRDAVTNVQFDRAIVREIETGKVLATITPEHPTALKLEEAIAVSIYDAAGKLARNLYPTS